MTIGHCFRPGWGGFHLSFSLFPSVPAGRQTGITLSGSSSSDPGGLASLGDRHTLAHLHLAQSPSYFGTEESGVSSTLYSTGVTGNGAGSRMIRRRFDPFDVAEALSSIVYPGKKKLFWTASSNSILEFVPNLAISVAGQELRAVAGLLGRSVRLWYPLRLHRTSKLEQVTWSIILGGHWIMFDPSDRRP